MRASDTSPEARQLQIELWRRMSSVEKARVISEINLAVRELALAGIRLRHPAATERECSLRLAILNLGPELAIRAYPEAAALLGG